MPRMHILSAVEQDRYERPPTFDSSERKRYFEFPRSAMDVAEDLRTPSSQIGFLLAYGYFRAVRRFFSPNDFHDRDIAYVANVLGPIRRFVRRTTLRKNKDRILITTSCF